MLDKEGIAELRGRLDSAAQQAREFFTAAQESQDHGPRRDDIWSDLLTPELREQGEDVRTKIKHLSIDIAGAGRGSPLIAKADLNDLRRHTRGMLASIHIHKYHYHGVYVHHDEDIVLGVDPPSQEESPLGDVGAASRAFEHAATAVREVIDLLSAAETVQTPTSGSTAAYRPNTAFIIMAIDKTKPELEDVKNTISEVCKEFGITAMRADDIEHDGVITDRILEEIDTSEFLIADLTDERPSVYYEIGHAHAKNRRVHSYRKEGTSIHFDIAHRNCPAYENITDLKTQLRRRLEAVTNKPSGS